MRKLLTLSAVAALLFAGVAAGKPPAPPSGAAAPKSPQISGSLGSKTALQPYTSDEGRFTVQFPAGEVKHDTEPINLAGGGSSTLNEFSVEQQDGNVSYLVMYNDYPPNYANDGADAVLARTRDGAVKGKTLLSDMAINLRGVPGREFTARDANWNYTVRQFLQGKRLYQLIIVSDNAHPATQTSAFLDSFRIN
jgi:hypothetical protein